MTRELADAAISADNTSYIVVRLQKGPRSWIQKWPCDEVACPPGAPRAEGEEERSDSGRKVSTTGAAILVSVGVKVIASAQQVPVWPEEQPWHKEEEELRRGPQPDDSPKGLKTAQRKSTADKPELFKTSEEGSPTVERTSDIPQSEDEVIITNGDENTATNNVQRVRILPQRAEANGGITTVTGEEYSAWLSGFAIDEVTILLNEQVLGLSSVNDGDLRQRGNNHPDGTGPHSKTVCLSYGLYSMVADGGFGSDEEGSVLSNAEKERREAVKEGINTLDRQSGGRGLNRLIIPACDNLHWVGG